jgi:hypothetical protein
MHFVDAQTHGFDYRLDFNDWFRVRLFYEDR